VRVPASTWDAIVGHVRDPADAARLADSARSRLLYGCAIPLYRQAADAGDGYAAGRLVDLLKERGDLDGLRARADAGNEHAARRLADLLAERGDLDGLRARAGVYDASSYAAMKLADLLAERGDLDEAMQVLRAWADAGYLDAARGLAVLLAERGDLDELRARTDAGDPAAAELLARLPEQRGDLDGAAHVLRVLADAGDMAAGRRLAGLLKERGDLDEAMQVLRSAADAYDMDAARGLANLLAERGDLDELRARTDDFDVHAGHRLVELLMERGDLDELEDRMTSSISPIKVDRLPEQPGELDMLRARSDSGDNRDAVRLAELLAQRGDLNEAMQVLRSAADANDFLGRYATNRYATKLAYLLAKRGDMDELRARVDAGDEHAAGPLAGLLIKQGRREEAKRLRRFGLNPDGSIAGTAGSSCL